MREILFRGKAVKVGVWLYGSYVKTTEALTDRPVSLIIPERGEMNPGGNFTAVEVDPSTVGQFTGLADSQRQRIFEGDILSDTFGYLRVVWKDGAFGMSARRGNFTLMYPERDYERRFFERIAKVAGNVFDNPELGEWGDEK